MSDGTLHTRLHIRRGTPQDADNCQKLIRSYRNLFGFVMRSSLIEAAERGTLHIAEVDGIFAGFVSFRACQDRWQTVYEIAVDSAFTGTGVGRNLLYSVPTPIRLKCPVDNTASNQFYANAGMMLSHVEDAKRPLNVWHMRVLCIHCQGKNKRVPAWSRASGMAYGSRQDHKPHDYTFMQDVNFKAYNERPAETWQDYAHKAALWRPVMAFAADYMHPSQRETMLEQVAYLRSIGTLRIAVCPKFPGAVADIPADCIVAVSLPSGYAGFVPSSDELLGRRVHLLGGTVDDNRNSITRWNVISIDTSRAESNVKYGHYFDGGVWVNSAPITKRVHEREGLIVANGINIRKALNEATKYLQAVLL